MPADSMPYVCFACRKSFKHRRRFGGEGRVGECPVCHGPSIALHPHFKAPRATDLKQWRKVEILVANGFYFQRLRDWSIGNTIIKYPDTIQEAEPWVKRWRHLVAGAKICG